MVIRVFAVVFFLVGTVSATAQLRFLPVWDGSLFAPEIPFFQRDTFVFSMFKCYVGDVQWFGGGKLLRRDSRYHLLTFGEGNREPALEIPAGADALTFTLGVDSATTMEAAMLGDLDPALGMFWTWQSGYIQVKTEGAMMDSLGRKFPFEYHLGGFMPPYQTARRLRFSVPPAQPVSVCIDLACWFASIDVRRHPRVMSPGKTGTHMMDQLATCMYLIPNPENE
jgi:hypothetical protein